MYQHSLIFLPFVFAQLFSFGYPCGCPNGWKGLLDDNDCINIFPDQNLTWNEAQTFCSQKFGGTLCWGVGMLAILEFANINQIYGNYVLNKTGGNLTEWWVGATTEFAGAWTWNNRSIDFAYRNFASGQVCPPGSTDCCATVTLPYFKWNIRSCNESRFPFLCEWQYAG